MKNGDAESPSQMGKEKELMDNGKGKQLMVMKSDPKVEAGEAAAAQRNHQNVYPKPLANYKDVIQDAKLFMDTLGKLHAAMGTKFMIPTIGGKELNLHRLFMEVTSRGGIEKVIADRRWREITAAFNFPSTATNASFVVRKYYLLLLLHYEQIYFFESEGWNSPPTGTLTVPSVTSVSSERWFEPSSQLAPNTSSARKRRTNGELPPAGPSMPADNLVAGVIDGKFEHGYFVTVTVGTQKLKGVLFHPVDSGTAPGGTNLKAARRRRRRRKPSDDDPTRPKPRLSGYNYFFAEQHARLKPLHPGKNGTISKMIGDLWKNLSMAEKAVYDERGEKDKERFVSEMAVYRERSKSGIVISDAVPIQQRRGDDVDSKMEVDEEGDNSSSNDCSDVETEEKKSDEESEELGTSPEIFVAGTESMGLGADPSSNEGEGFELRARSELKMKNEDAEPEKVTEQAASDQL